jgi:hypothetical protein
MAERVRLAAVAVLIAALMAAADGHAQAGPAGPPPRMFAFVSGLGGAELARLRAVGDRIDVVAPNWFGIDVASGRIAGGGSYTQPFRRAARAAKTHIWPVVNARTGGSAVVERAAWRGRVARRIARIARNQRYAGMTIDIEELAPDQGAAFSSLVRLTARLLHRQDRRLAVYVPRPFTAYGAAYDWPALERSADLLLASGYNEHAAGSVPGPIATTEGFAAVLEHAAAVSRTKIAPTIGAFGYLWPKGGGAGELVSTAELVRLQDRCHATGRSEGGSVSFRCSGRVGVYESTRALVARAEATSGAGFRWLALFSLGREPRAFWNRVTTYRDG